MGFMLLKEKMSNISTASEQVKASVAYTACSVVQRCLSMITVPFFARVLTEEEYGISTVYASAMGVLIVFTSLELPYGTFSLAMAKFDERDKYVSAVNGLCTVLASFYFLAYWAFSDLFNLIFRLPTILMVIMGFEMLFSTSKMFWMAKNRYELKYKKVIWLTLIQSILSVAMCVGIVSYVSSEKGLYRVITCSAIEIIVGSVIYVQCVLKGKAFFDGEFWKYALKFNIPLLPYYLSQMVFNQSDRLMIDYLVDRGAVAKYGVAYSAALTIQIVLTAVNNSYIPWVYERIKRKDYGENRSFSVGLAIGMSVMLLCVIAVGPEVILILGGQKYMDAMWVIPPVAMSLLFLLYTQFFANILFFFESKYMLVIGSFLAAITNVILNYWLIPKYGYVSAAYTTLLSYIVFAMSNYFFMKVVCKKKQIKEPLFYEKKLILIACCLFIGAMILVGLYEHTFVRYLVIALLVCATCIYRKKIYVKVRYYLALFK